jgi:hypothetical protein
MVKPLLSLKSFSRMNLEDGINGVLLQVEVGVGGAVEELVELRLSVEGVRAVGGRVRVDFTRRIPILATNVMILLILREN